MSYLWITKRIVSPLHSYKCIGLLKELSDKIINDNIYGLIDHKHYQGLTLNDKLFNNNEIIWSCSSWTDYHKMKSWENSKERKIILNKYKDIIIFEEHSIMFKEPNDIFLL